MVSKTILGTTIILVLAFVMCIVYIRLPLWLTYQVHFDQNDQQALFLASTRASVATLLGSILTTLTVLTATATAYVTYRNYLATQDKQLADTLAKGTELLGSDESSTRLGGIFVLRRIAATSRQDRRAAMLVKRKDQCAIREENGSNKSGQGKDHDPR